MRRELARHEEFTATVEQIIEVSERICEARPVPGTDTPPVPWAKKRHPMRADNPRHVIAAARRRAKQTRQRAIGALRRMDAVGQRITFGAVAREALLTELSGEFQQFNG